MQGSQTYFAFSRTVADGILDIEKVEESFPTLLGPEEVLVQIRAVSLNYRDVAMLQRRYNVDMAEDGIVCSDCAAEVVRVGDAVHAFAIGDCVAPIFDLNNVAGDEKKPMAALGGDQPGVLRQFAVFAEAFLVHLPDHLTWEEASTIACAGVTAWNALDLPRSANRGYVAVLQGTGGVSLFALHLCLAAGIKAIITSSSDAKLAAIRALGPEGSILTVNYKSHPNWEDEVMRLTEGVSADIVINNIGPSGLTKAASCLRVRSQVSMVGFLEDSLGDAIDPAVILMMTSKFGKMQPIAVGSKVDFQNLNTFLEKHQIRLSSLVDRVFSFDDAKDAFNYLKSGEHVGKIVVRV